MPVASVWIVVFNQRVLTVRRSEGGLQLAYIGTKILRENELNDGLGHAMVRLDI